MEKKSMKMALRRDVIKKIENKTKTQLRFSKQRQGLFKEADAVVKMCEAELAIIIMSNAGDVYSFGHPNADSVFQRYKAHKSSFDQRDEGNDDNKKHNLPENEEIDDRSGKEESQKGMSLTAGSEMNNQEIDKKMALWDVPVENLLLHELEQLLAHLEEMKKEVCDRANQMNMGNAESGDFDQDSCLSIGSTNN